MMVLDPATSTFLEGLRASGGKPLYEMAVDEVRAMVKWASVQLAPPVTEVHQVVERKIPVDGGEFGIRIYTPRPIGAATPLPIALHCHGGGWVAGDIDTHDSLARYCCKHADVIVIGVDYRRPPEDPFPAAVDDAYAAVQWAVAHAGELGGDKDRVAVVGDSAGGNLSAVVCQLAKARGGPSIAFQALLYPTVDLSVAATYPSRAEFGGGEFFLSNRDMDFFRSHYLADIPRQAEDPRASPLLAGDLTGLPPALIVTAGCDPLRDEGKAYADRLAAAGVPVEYRCFEQTIHAFMSFAGAIPVGLDALAFVASRLRAALHGA